MVWAGQLRSLAVHHTHCPGDAGVTHRTGGPGWGAVPGGGGPGPLVGLEQVGHRPERPKSCGQAPGKDRGGEGVGGALGQEEGGQRAGGRGLRHGRAGRVSGLRWLPQQGHITVWGLTGRRSHKLRAAGRCLSERHKGTRRPPLPPCATPTGSTGSAPTRLPAAHGRTRARAPRLQLVAVFNSPRSADMSNSCGARPLPPCQGAPPRRRPPGWGPASRISLMEPSGVLCAICSGAPGPGPLGRGPHEKGDPTPDPVGRPRAEPRRRR